uniref:NTR domain-containing protein n=1 Tax=Ditylenchus dipsaci TaxID=166011 RepID=A0A915DFW3_9BILA
MKRRFVLYLITVFDLFVFSISCKCPEPDIIDTFCHADFVGHIKVLAKEIGPGVKHVESFKDGNWPEQITTSGKDSSCSVELEIGKDYILSGYKASSSIKVTKCDVATEWDYLRMQEKRQIWLKNFQNCEAPLCVQNKAALYTSLCN